MQTGRDGFMSVILRRVVIAGLALAAAGTAPALAQVTIRIVPTPVLFPAAGGATSLEVWVDNIPAPGMGSFVIHLEKGGQGSGCLTFTARSLDPALMTAWGGSNNQFVSDSGDVVVWTGSAFPGFHSPTGTVRLGTLTYTASSNATSCPPNRTQGTFAWLDPDSVWGEGLSASNEFDVLEGAFWAIGAPPDRDLTVTCTRVAPPGVDPNTFDSSVFVDGDTIQLDCQISNLGNDPNIATNGAILASVFSDDLAVDGGDAPLIAQQSVGMAAGVTAVNRTLAGTPFVPTAQLTNICTKIDVVVSNLDDDDGVFFETDESNNTDCIPVSVLASRKDLIADPDFSSDPNFPSPIILTPSSVDPNFHAGLTLQVAFGALNQGAGAIRGSYRNSVHLGSSLTAIQSNPSASFMCSKLQPLGGAIPFQKGGVTLDQAFGLDPDAADPNVPADPNEICQIKFTQPPGNYVLAVRLDANNNVAEEDPNGSSPPAEGNNWASVPITVEAALPPQIRVRENATNIGDTNVDVFEPPTPQLPGKAAISIISVQNLASYSLTLTWSPANLLDVDPNGIDFTNFLEENGRDQTCGFTLDDPNGILSVSCTTVPSADPNVSNAGATSEGHATLLTVQFLAAFPGQGDFDLSNLSAANPAGTPIAGLSAPVDSTFTVTGDPVLRVTNAVPPAVIVPGVTFTTSYDIENSGFGSAPTPIQSRVVLSQDAVTDPHSPAPDVIACTSNETTPIAAFSTRQKSLSTCRLLDDALPGTYTGFYQVNATTTGDDPNSWDVVNVPVPARVVALRKSGKGRTAETYLEPDPNGSTGLALASTSKFGAQGVSVIGSGSRSLNWLVGLRSASSSPRKLQVHTLPKSANEKLDVLTSLRLPKEVRAIFGGADVDGDGEDELILLRSLKTGDVLDFRRVDFTQRKPLICQSAATTDPNTPPFTGSVVDAAGIEYDGSPGDELAVVTDDGTLTIYDLTINGSPPPAFPCKPVPAVIESPAEADILPLASDTGFGAPGDEALSICTLDFGLDGNEEIAGLHVNTSGVQTLRIYGAPASLGGTATLLAEDAAFGGTQSRATVLAIACTR